MFKILSYLTKIYVWVACGWVVGKLAKVIRIISTLPTVYKSIEQLICSFTQLFLQFTAGFSPTKYSYFTTVKSIDIHSIHLAYNYNYLYI